MIKYFSNPQAISNPQKKEKSIKIRKSEEKKPPKKKINKDINLLTCLLNLINEKRRNVAKF